MTLEVKSQAWFSDSSVLPPLLVEFSFHLSQWRLGIGWVLVQLFPPFRLKHSFLQIELKFSRMFSLTEASLWHMLRQF